jgi:hypothetical protein
MNLAKSDEEKRRAGGMLAAAINATALEAEIQFGPDPVRVQAAIHNGSAAAQNSPAESPAAPLNSYVRPFGPMEPTSEVDMARMHIEDEWERCLKLQACDALGGELAALNDCIRHHPGLRTESEALDAMCDAHNELVGLGKAEESKRWDGRKLTGAELWFVRKLSASDFQPFSGFLGLLEDSRDIFDGDSRVARVSSAIQKILDGQWVMNKVRMYLKSI